MVIKPKKLVDPEETPTSDEGKAVERGFRQHKRGEYVDWEALKNELGLQAFQGCGHDPHAPPTGPPG